MANAGAPEPTPSDVALKVWLENMAEVVGAILTRRAQSGDDGGRRGRKAREPREDRHEDS